jgi:transposase
MLVAVLCDIPLTNLGKPGKSGILQSKATRKAFLEEESHRIRFVYMPKHCSWLNQIENWFSGLSTRVLKRGNFVSVENLEKKS